MPTISIERSSPTFKKNGSPARRRPSALTSAIRQTNLPPSAQRTDAVTSMGSRAWARRVCARFLMIKGRSGVGNSSQLPVNRALCCVRTRSEEHTSELQSRLHLVCRLLLEKKKKRQEQNSKKM